MYIHIIISTPGNQPQPDIKVSSFRIQIEMCIRDRLAPDLTDDTGNGGAAVFTVSIPYGLINLAG